MLRLPDVTLVLIETREHALARLALRDCLRHVDFGDVLVFTDRLDDFSGPGRVKYVPDWPDKMGWCRHHWQEVAPYVGTSHTLAIQWDSWVVDPGMWRKEFLEYDYIGAPWWYKDGMNVGNGGFCLRSTSLMRYLRKHRDRFPCTNTLDDDLLCRKYRAALQEEGFTWAPDSIALDFAFEVVRPIPNSRHFGFHASYNFGYGCGGDMQRLLERARLMIKSKYLTEQHTYFWNGFCNKNPGVAEALEGEGYTMPKGMEKIPQPGDAGESDIRDALQMMKLRDDLKEAHA